MPVRKTPEETAADKRRAGRAARNQSAAVTKGWGKSTHQVLLELRQSVNVPYIMVEGKIPTPGEVERGC